jgi:hypothetical protein
VNRDDDSGFWWIATALSVAVVAALHFFGVSPLPPPTLPAHADAAPLNEAANADENPAAPHTTPVVTDPVIATVYECRQNGIRVFSDSRCGTGAEVRTVHAPNRMDAQAIFVDPEPTEAVAGSTAPPQRAPAEEPVQKMQCREIQALKDQINARMRAGYGAAEGEHLRDRLRKLDDEYYALHCRTTRDR